MDELAKLDATAQADLVKQGKASPSELVEAAIARIERLNPELNAVITPLYEQARRAAVSDSLPDGPFRGVPFLIKDLDVPTAGDPFHCGMRLLKEMNYVAPADSYLAAKFRATGLVNLGKTNTPELGLTVTTEPESYGPSRNPWNLEHSTGGSSGGSAAAVASGMVPIAHASDGGGSIRIPASECGLVGLKPTRGRISQGPQYGEYWDGLVVSLVVSKSVRDTASVLDAVCGPMPGDPYFAPPPAEPFSVSLGKPPSGLRIGLMPRTPNGTEPLHPDCVVAVENAGRALEELGHKVEVASPEALDDAEFSAHFSKTVVSWTAAAMVEWGRILGRVPGAEDMEAATWQFVEMGNTLSAADMIETKKWIAAYTRRMSSWFTDGFDVLVTPTIAGPPPKLGELLGSPEEPLDAGAKVLGLIPYTPPFNATGQPAISLPLHWSDEGLPIGVQFVADHTREDLLLGVAAQLEAARPWASRTPPVFA